MITILTIHFKLKGKTAKEIVGSKEIATVRLQWSLISPEGISFPFDGVPFICVGTVNYQCHQGNDVKYENKNKEARGTG